MTRQSTKRKAWIALGLAVWMVVAPGCQSWQTACPCPCLSFCPCPRIDPTGQKLFLWPGETPAPVLAPPPAYPPPAFPVGAPIPIGAPVPVGSAVAPPPPLPISGNLQAAPIYSGAPAATLPPAPITTVGPAVAVVPTSVLAPPMGAEPIGIDHLKLSPNRVMAPVGSEVVLKAGICGADGYLHADRRVEWQLTRDGAGHFVDLGDRGDVDVFRMPWDTPRKVDNWYAIGSTAYAPHCLNQGTPDPRDDVQVVRGEAWITVTSPTAGTSHVTAYAPDVDNWQFRQAATTIYWIDAQWAFPPSTVAQQGRPQTLTTTVMRRTDGAPLAGWTVRYDVSGGGASLGYAGGNFVDVPTDASGRASVEVSPTNAGGGTSNIGITIVRPAMAGPESSPQLEVGRGAATITWGSAATAPIPATSQPTLQPTPGSPISPAPITQTPITPTPSRDLGGAVPYQSPTNQPTVGAPRLDVRLVNVGPQATSVGGLVSFDLTVTNRGESTARHIMVDVNFDIGLSHAGDTENKHAINYNGMNDLPPNQSATIPLTFTVGRAGTLCHTVKVTADGAEPVTKRECVTGRAAAISISIRGPVRRTVGDVAQFVIVVKNTGDVPATNFAIVQKFPPALQAVPQPREQDRLQDGSLRIIVPSLAVNEQRKFETQAQCIDRSDRAVTTATVVVEGSEPQSQETFFEIVAPGP